MNYKFRYAFIGIAAAVLAIYTVFIRRHSSLTEVQAGYAALIVALGLLPGAVALLDKREAGLIPLMPLHGLFYAVAYGLPAFSANVLWLAGEEAAKTAPLVLAVIGLLCLYLGYYAFRGLCGGLKPIRYLNIPLKKQIRAAWIMVGVYLLFQFFPFLKTIPSLDQLSILLGYLSLGILALLAFSGQLSRPQLALFIVAAALTLLIATLSGLMSFPVFFLVFFSILYWNKKRRIPWHFIALCVLITAILSPVKTLYRDYAWYGEEASLSYYNKTILFYGVVKEYYSGSAMFAKVREDATTGTLNRLAHISTFGYIIAMTPRNVPYWEGDSYQTLWTSFIPRMLWPGKPQSTIGQAFGHRYSLITREDEWTSINLPWLVEFYANFGAIGVLAGMFFVGIFFRILVQKFSVPVSAPIEHSLAVTIMFNLFYAEANFALMVGGILTTYIAFIVLRRLLTGGFVSASSDLPQVLPLIK